MSEELKAIDDSNDKRELLTVIVPCLNEEHSVEKTVESIISVGRSLPVNIKILMIDDGSTDGTAQVMDRLCRIHSFCEMKRNPENLGLGRSVLNTYDMIAHGSWVTVMPGDHEFMFESIRNHLRVRHDADIILGYLHNPVVRPLTRRLASYSFSKLVSTLYGFPYRYLNGMKMYRVEAFRDIDVCSSGHAFNAELLAKALLKNPLVRITEVPFSARGRGIGESKAFRFRSILRAVREVIVGYRSVGKYRSTMAGKSLMD